MVGCCKKMSRPQHHQHHDCCRKAADVFGTTAASCRRRRLKWAVLWGARCGPPLLWGTRCGPPLLWGTRCGPPSTRLVPSLLVADLPVCCRCTASPSPLAAATQRCFAGRGSEQGAASSASQPRQLNTALHLLCRAVLASPQSNVANYLAN